MGVLNISKSVEQQNFKYEVPQNIWTDILERVFHPPDGEVIEFAILAMYVEFTFSADCTNPKAVLVIEHEVGDETTEVFCTEADSVTLFDPEEYRSLLQPSNPAPPSKSQTRSKASTAFQLLTLFRDLCGPKGREVVGLAEHDIRAQERAMVKAGKSEKYVKRVIWWRTIGTILPVFWAGFLRTINAVEPVLKFFSRK